jgi:hypothetical protein
MPYLHESALLRQLVDGFIRRAFSSERAEEIHADVALAENRGLDWKCFGLHKNYVTWQAARK